MATGAFYNLISPFGTASTAGFTGSTGTLLVTGNATVVGGLQVNGGLTVIGSIDVAGDINAGAAFLSVDTVSAGTVQSSSGIFTNVDINGNIDMQTNAVLNQSYLVAPKTINYGINSSTGESNTLFTNAGAGAGVQFTLPSVANNGQTYTFVVAAAQTLTVLAQGTHRFQGIASAGGTRTLLTSLAQFNTAQVAYVNTNVWQVLVNSGFTCN